MSESPSPRLQFRRLLPLLVMLLFVLGFPVPVRAQGTAAARLADFDTFVARALAEYRVPGAAVAVVEDGKVTFIKGYGLRDVTKPGKVDQERDFPARIHQHLDPRGFAKRQRLDNSTRFIAPWCHSTMTRRHCRR